jgi:hypothetical protein
MERTVRPATGRQWKVVGTHLVRMVSNGRTCRRGEFCFR